MRLVLALVFVLQLYAGFGQQKYWVYINSNDLLNKSIVEKRLRDYGAEITSYSKWLNAFSVLTNSGITQLQIPPIDSIRPVAFFKPFSRSERLSKKLAFALDQINANIISEKGFTGKGVKIGIIDGGFLKADKDPRLAHFFQNNQVRAYKDFVTPALDHYGGSKHYGDDHGNQVWHMIAGQDPKTKVQFGIATGADFYLARTDDGRTDFRAEEDYLVAALEWMDSLGVKLVNISIGYSTGFENPAEDYQPADMDGKTVALTRAAQIATTEKGMLLVVAGGNDGNVENFQVVSTPADARDVLTVGATGYKTWQKVNYSSIGADFLDYLKPDISCYSSDGTSFSAPIITGLAAAIWEMKPHLTNMEVKDLILGSGHLSKSPNNYLGYGVPDADKIFGETLGPERGNHYSEIQAKKNAKLTIPNKDRIIIYHKKDRFNVIEQENKVVVASKIRIARPPGIARTTIAAGLNIIEIIWKD